MGKSWIFISGSSPYYITRGGIRELIKRNILIAFFTFKFGFNEKPSTFRKCPTKWRSRSCVSSLLTKSPFAKRVCLMNMKIFVPVCRVSFGNCEGNTVTAQIKKVDWKFYNLKQNGVKCFYLRLLMRYCHHHTRVIVFIILVRLLCIFSVWPPLGQFYSREFG